MAIMDTREQSTPDTTARLSRTLDSVFRMNSDAENVPASQPNVDLDLGWLSDSIAEKTRAVTTQSKELAELETRLRETEQRLALAAQSNNLPSKPPASHQDLQSQLHDQNPSQNTIDKPLPVPYDSQQQQQQQQTYAPQQQLLPQPQQQHQQTGLGISSDQSREQARPSPQRIESLVRGMPGAMPPPTPINEGGPMGERV